jgi:hypothetical protein
MRRKKAGQPCEGCEARQAQIRTLEMQLAAMEGVIAVQNGAMDEMGKLLGKLEGGMVARLVAILERHGVKVNRTQQPLQ